MIAFINLVCFVDGHLREVSRPEGDSPYRELQQQLHSGHKRLRGWTWEATHGVNRLTWRPRCPDGGRRGEMPASDVCRFADCDWCLGDWFVYEVHGTRRHFERIFDPAVNPEVHGVSYACGAGTAYPSAP